jgi:phage-related protein
MLSSRKSIIWISSTRKDIQAMPTEVKRDLGNALDEAQKGNKHPNVKPLLGFGGASVLEIVSNFATDAYRAVHAVRFEDAIYVLHVFQKKSMQCGKRRSVTSMLSKVVCNRPRQCTKNTCSRKER